MIAVIIAMIALGVEVQKYHTPSGKSTYVIWLKCECANSKNCTGEQHLSCLIPLKLQRAVANETQRVVEKDFSSDVCFMWRDELLLHPVTRQGALLELFNWPLVEFKENCYKRRLSNLGVSLSSVY